MLGITGLITPILIGAGLFLGVAVADTQAIYIREMIVPPSLAQAGFTATVVDHRINDNILALERQARTRTESRRLATEADKTPLELVADYLNLSLLVRAIQDATRLTEYSIHGSIVQQGPEYVMRITVRRHAGQRTLVTIRRPVGEIEELLQDAADGILRVTDPHILCTYRLRQGLTATPPSLDAAQDCITASLRVAADSDKLWLYNLLGVVAYLREDQAGALAAFQASLRIDREFSPALLNLGMLFAHNGRHEDAIRAFAAVFNRVTVGESPQTYAATYTEWGNSLMVLGRPHEARARYADAIRTDHRYAPAYFSWAQSLPPGREADALRHYGSIVAAVHDQLYTENLVGALHAGQMPGQRQ